ncbi:MAG TPA: hypothetical protein VG795_12345 [Acidimicrobiia bacterium]|nr:hypothetical protein [Acidimicrobiia bacterium]
MTEVYEVGGRRLGVRWSRPGLDSELRALASGALGVQDAPANISIVVGEQTGRTRSKHELHIQGQLSSTTSSDGGLIRAVIRALGALAAEPPPGSVLVDALLVIDPDGNTIAVDRRLAADVRRLGPALRRRGGRLIQPSRLVVRPDRGAAVLPDATEALGVPVEAVDARWPLEPGDDDLTSGEVTVTRFVYAGRAEPESRADALADMLWMVRDRTGRVERTAVARFAAFTDHFPLEAVVRPDRGRLAGALGLI